MTRKKRKYTRLAPSTWAEVRALWETGNHDLAELSDRFGVSRRSIQSHVRKHGSAKGSKAAEMAAVVQKEIFKEELGDQETITRRAKETREAAYANAVVIGELVMAQLALAQKDPAQAFKAASAMKVLSLAAGTVERTQTIRLRALGLDKENAPPDVMPELIIRDLSKEEKAALEARNEDDEESEIGFPLAPADTDSVLVGAEIHESDDIVEEGGEIADEEIIVEGVEPEEPAKPHPEFSAALGGRLVKEAKA